MNSELEVTSFHSIHTNYIRNSRAIAVLWAVFTICFCIINIVVFMQPWLGDTDSTEKEGYFGLYEACKFEVTTYQIVGIMPQVRTESRLNCDGTWTSLSTAVNPIATFFIGFSCLMNLLCIAVFLVLFLFISPAIIFTICGALQLISTICMIMGCSIYPNNWDSKQITEICETSTSYYVGKCQIRWAYVLAIIGIFDILFLCILAFVLARRQAPAYASELTDEKNIYSIQDTTAYDNMATTRSAASFQDFQL